MVGRYKTALIFWSAVFLSLISLVLALVAHSFLSLLLVISAAFNLWCIRTSDRSGFVKTKQLRRAHEPARRFNSMQTFVLLGLVMCQIGVGTYALFTSPGML